MVPLTVMFSDRSGSFGISFAFSFVFSVIAWSFALNELRGAGFEGEGRPLGGLALLFVDFDLAGDCFDLLVGVLGDFERILSEKMSGNEISSSASVNIPLPLGRCVLVVPFTFFFFCGVEVSAFPFEERV